MYSKAKILGHPIHPMLVAFPVAFYTATLIAYVLYAATGTLLWFHVGVIANLAGVAGAVAAAIPGFIDWAFGIPDRHPAKPTGLQHMLLNVGALIVFAINGYLQWGQWNEQAPAYGIAILLAGTGVLLTLAAGWLGWTMVQKHHVGVDMSPVLERTDMARPSQRPINTDRPAIHGA